MRLRSSLFKISDSLYAVTGLYFVLNCYGLNVI